MIGSLIAALATGETVEALQRAKRMAIAYVIAALFSGIGLGFLIAAGYIRVERDFGSLHTALMFGGGFVLVGLIVLVWQGVSSNRKAKRFAKHSNVQMKKIAIAAGFTALPMLIRSRAGPSLIALPVFAAIAAAIYHESRKRPLRMRGRRDYIS